MNRMEHYRSDYTTSPRSNQRYMSTSWRSLIPRGPTDGYELTAFASYPDVVAVDFEFIVHSGISLEQWADKNAGSFGLKKQERHQWVMNSHE